MQWQEWPPVTDRSKTEQESLSLDGPWKDAAHAQNGKSRRVWPQYTGNGHKRITHHVGPTTTISVENTKCDISFLASMRTHFLPEENQSSLQLHGKVLFHGLGKKWGFSLNILFLPYPNDGPAEVTLSRLLYRGLTTHKAQQGCVCCAVIQQA